MTENQKITTENKIFAALSIVQDLKLWYMRSPRKIAKFEKIEKELVELYRNVDKDF